MIATLHRGLLRTGMSLIVARIIHLESEILMRMIPESIPIPDSNDSQFDSTL